MNPRYIVACVVTWIFVFLYEWLLHGVILKPLYMESQDLWRLPEAMCAHMPWLIAGQVVFVFLFGFIFTKGYENRGVWEGARYGWLIGLLLAAPTLIMYAVMPVPPLMIVGWGVGSLIEWTLAGMILAAIYRPLRAT